MLRHTTVWQSVEARHLFYAKCRKAVSSWCNPTAE
ncbi:hypothetical protein HYP93_gp38 [Stenotrophomonas phage Pokken]|uniref:Uncharacterized protein n=1 Tax=Stenotrophomonas phage Pokken TaxID=2596674 RepID=A0A5B9NCQ6_9CAUD|nr:hypothetical protein HYP93_gp38 [Stenotrophomonas phage Pokken]QEG09261.1 hypothetical protein CPT_Pokken_038 [Stenotrophomonas phage Pokken]